MHQTYIPILRELDNSFVEIDASVLLSTDGLVMATTLPLAIDADHIGAVCAGMFRLGHRTAEKCASGLLNQVWIQSEEKYVVMLGVGAEIILVVIISKPYTDLEGLFSNLGRFIEKIAALA